MSSDCPDFTLDLYNQAGIEALIQAEQDQIDQTEARRLYGEISYMPKWSIQTNLPHKDPGRINSWTRENGDSTLTVQPFIQEFRRSNKLVRTIHHGIPYGTIPRLFLAYVGWHVVYYKSPVIDLGDNLTGFMGELGLVKKGGKNGTNARVKDQVHRMATCRIVYTDKGKIFKGFQLASDIDEYWNVKNPSQQALWKNTMTLTHEAYMSFLRHRVPVNMATLRALKKSALALDIYDWLSWRMFSVNKAGEPTKTITYEMLSEQFGSGYARLRDFKAYFDREMRKVLAEYRDAKVESNPNGIMLYPSKTHVLPA